MPWHAGLDKTFLDKPGSVTAQQTDDLNVSNALTHLLIYRFATTAAQLTRYADQ